MLAVTTFLLVQQREAPLSENLAHIVSLVQTMLGIVSTAAWLWILAPIFFPQHPQLVGQTSVVQQAPCGDGLKAQISSADTHRSAAVSVNIDEVAHRGGAATPVTGDEPS